MRLVALTLALAALLAAEAAAGPGDRLRVPLVQPDGVAGGLGWDNASTDARLAFKRCRGEIVVKRAGALAGQPVVCIASADLLAAALPPGEFGAGVPVAGVFDSSGRLKIRADLGAVGCGGAGDILARRVELRCYLADAATWDPAASCTSAAMVWTPPDPAVPDAPLGLCLGTSAGAGERLPPPPGSELARVGVLTRAP